MQIIYVCHLKTYRITYRVHLWGKFPQVLGYANYIYVNSLYGQFLDIHRRQLFLVRQAEQLETYFSQKLIISTNQHTDCKSRDLRGGSELGIF